MNFGEIKKLDIANGEGIRVSLFVSGCTNHCDECFQPETWNFNYGKEFTAKEEDEIIEALAPDYIKGLSLLGGEPFEPDNQKALLPFLQKIKKLYPQKDIWCFSGFLLDEELLKPGYARTAFTDEMLSLIDVLVDGRYKKELRNLSLKFRGSSNQRVIDLKRTLSDKKIVLYF